MKIFGTEIVKSSEIESLRESTRELARQLEDLGWININNRESQSQDMVRESYEKMVRRCRMAFIKFPLAAQAVYLTTYYTFGSGVSKPKAKDNNARVQDIINDFWDDPDNVISLTGSQPQLKLSNKLQYDGEIALVIQVDTDGSCFTRIIDPLSINQIIYDDSDAMRPLFYKRKKKGAVDEFEYIPDISNGAAVATIANEPKYFAEQLAKKGIKEEAVVKRAFVIHVQVNNDILDSRGIPEVWRGLEWMNANNKINNDTASFINAQSQYAVKKKVKGTPAQVRAMAGRLRQDPQQLNKPSFQGGSTLVENEGVDTEAIDLKPGSGQLFEIGIRRTLLMVCANFGIMEHYFGDPSTGNLATATAMELPMLKKFQARQKLWEDVYSQVLQFAIDMDILAGGVNAIDFNENRNRCFISKGSQIDDRGIDIDFPPILEKDIDKIAQAWASAKKEGLTPIETARRMFMQAAGINNIDEEMEKEFQEPMAPTLPGFGAQDPPKDNAQESGPKIKSSKHGWHVVSKSGAKISKVYETAKEANARVAQLKHFSKKANMLKEAVASKQIRAGKENAVRLADKNKKTLTRMQAYLMEIAKHYRKFNQSIGEGFKTAVGPEQKYSPRIKGLDTAVSEFKNAMLESADKFIPEAVQIGREYADSHAPVKEGAAPKLWEAKKIDAWTRAQISWNYAFVTGSLAPDLKRRIEETQLLDFSTEELAMKEVKAVVSGFEARVASYAAAFWTIEERTVREAATESGANLANFVGVDDGSNCDDCQGAIEGNPWPASDIPIPGDQQCHGNCRHAIQIVGDDDLAESDIQLLRESEEMYRNGISILERT